MGRPLESGGRNKTTDLGELGQQCSYIWGAGAEGYQKQEPAATVLLKPLDQGSVLGDIQFAYWMVFH